MLRCLSECARVLRPMRSVALLTVVSMLLALCGCKSHCRQLSEKLCDCAVNSTKKTECLQLAATQEANNPPTAQNELYCEAVIESCDCRLIDTPSGKERCALAFAADAGL